MPLFRPFNYHVNLNGGYTGNSSVGGKTFYVGASGYAAAYGGLAPSDSNTGLAPQAPFATIQKGLDSCTAGRGDTVALLPGSYTITAVLTMTLADVTLRAAQGSSPLAYPGVTIATATASISMLDIDADNCVVDGIRFDQNNTTAAVPIIDVADTTASVGVIIRNCWIDMEGSATNTDGIRLGDGTIAATNCRIEGCVVHDYDQDGIVVSAASDENTIENCLVYDNVTANVGQYGISCAGDNTTIEGCTVFNEGTGGIYLNGTENRVYYCKVAAWAANAIAILHAASSAGASGGCILNAVSAGNLVDFTTASTSPASDASTGNVYASDPAAAALTTATVDGT